MARRACARARSPCPIGHGHDFGPPACRLRLRVHGPGLPRQLAGPTRRNQGQVHRRFFLLFNLTLHPPPTESFKFFKAPRGRPPFSALPPPPAPHNLRRGGGTPPAAPTP